MVVGMKRYSSPPKHASVPSFKMTSWRFAHGAASECNGGDQDQHRLQQEE